MQFTWQVFNVTNSVRFDTNPNTSPGNSAPERNIWEIIQRTLSKPRVMQFSLRYDFY